VLPAVFVTYSLAYLDRANYGFGAAAGLASTLHIDGQQSSLLSALFFIGYFIFQVPGIMLARKRSAARMVAVSLVAWGSLAAMTGIVRNFWILALVRFLLGVAESFIFPAMLLLLTRWFTKEERSQANTILMLGNPLTILWMSAITGFLIQSVGWQNTFILEGIPSIMWAFGWLAIIRDRPRDAGWMTPQASAQLQEKLDSEQSSIAPCCLLHVEPRRLWLCALASYDRSTRRGAFHGKHGTAIGSTLSCSGFAYACGGAMVGPEPSSAFPGMAVSVNRGLRTLLFLCICEKQLRARVRGNARGRRVHVRILRALLCLGSGAGSAQCHRRSSGDDQ
jgi:MFS family permease